MTLPAQDIVERLRDAAERATRTRAERYREAADTISRLTADNEALRDALSLANQRGDAWKSRAEASEARADALAQEVERLRGLLGYNNGKRE